MFPIYQVIFYAFSLLLIVSATFVIISKNPVRAILFLVLSFFATSVLWLLIQAEFLALVLIFVYVGAVMTLFLFVVMMLNIDISYLRENFVRYLPVGFVVMIILVALMVITVSPRHLGGADQAFKFFHTYNNTKDMGILLFTKYILPFEVAGLILLVAIISAITLAFHGKKAGTKTQNINEQHDKKRAQCVRLVDLEVEKS